MHREYWPSEPIRGSRLTFAYDEDAYEPMYGRDADGGKIVIGVQRRPQEEIDQRRAARKAKAS